MLRQMCFIFRSLYFCHIVVSGVFMSVLVMAAIRNRVRHYIFAQRFLSSIYLLPFTAGRNARIASAVLAIAIPSVCPSVTRSYCVKTTARSTVQFALSDSKMCLVL